MTRMMCHLEDFVKKMRPIIVFISINLLHVECKSSYPLKGRSTADILKGQNATTCPPRIKLDTSKMSTVSTIVAAYEGTVARMQCHSQNGDENGENVMWTYAKLLSLQLLTNLTFTPVVQKNRVVIQNGILSVYRTTMEDAGVYKCQTVDEILTSDLVILDVIDDEMYTLVKHIQGSNSTQPIGQELVAFKVWSPWSESKAGKRRRFGMCYVKLNTIGNETKNHYSISSTTIKLFQEFPEGMPCRSRHLPVEISNLPAVRNRTNTIMITTYKKQVKNEIFELRSPVGSILETANNSAGIYSLSQPLPPQPPPPGRSIMFVGRGQRVLLKCPGTTLRDVPVTWRTAEQVMDNAVLAASSGGRVYVDARDRLVIRHVLYEDANLYVCWEGDNIAGTAQLLVWGGPARWNHHTLLLAMAVVGGVLLHISVRLL